MCPETHNHTNLSCIGIYRVVMICPEMAAKVLNFRTKSELDARLAQFVEC